MNDDCQYHLIGIQEALSSGLSSREWFLNEAYLTLKAFLDAHHTQGLRFRKIHASRRLVATAQSRAMWRV